LAPSERYKVPLFWTKLNFETFKEVGLSLDGVDIPMLHDRHPVGDLVHGSAIALLKGECVDALEVLVISEQGDVSQGFASSQSIQYRSVPSSGFVAQMRPKSPAMSTCDGYSPLLNRLTLPLLSRRMEFSPCVSPVMRMLMLSPSRVQARLG